MDALPGNIARLCEKFTMKNATQYTKTVLVSSIDTDFNLRIGQWVTTETGSKGQYLGKTRAGVMVVRWQNREKFAKVDAKANRPLRQFAKLYGSK